MDTMADTVDPDEIALSDAPFYENLFLLMWLFTSLSTIFQLCRDVPSRVEPIQSRD